VILRICSDAEGESHFEDVRLAMNPLGCPLVAL
jgi:hypothetical protein